MAKNPKYYSLDNILKRDSEYNIILGQRSNGKSYAVKNHCIKKAWDNSKARFIVLRRLAEEIRPSVIEHYFSDVPINIITGGECDNIKVYRSEIWACKFDTDTDKNKKVKLLGYVRALIKAAQYKSGDYTDCTDIIYEEFIAETGARYLPNEPNELQSFVSTVARLRKISVWLVGNTISRICPYFTEWGLVNIPRQKQGTIDTYEVQTQQLDDNNEPIKIKISVENAEGSTTGKMFFGSAAKMIDNGAWHTSKQYPGLPRPYADYAKIYTVVMFGYGFTFLLELLQYRNEYVWFVTPKTTPIQRGTRTVSNTFSPDLMHTNGFVALNEGERRAFNLLLQNKIAYSDSLTAEDFLSVRKNLLNG